MLTAKPGTHLQVLYYRAPAEKKVIPFTIMPGFEVIELVTHGIVYFQAGKNDLTLGCGAMFWHRAGEETIHRTDPSSPYECLAVHVPVIRKLSLIHI